MCSHNWKGGSTEKKQLNPDYKFFMYAFTALPNPLRDWIKKKKQQKKLFALTLNEIIKEIPVPFKKQYISLEVRSE